MALDDTGAQLFFRLVCVDGAAMAEVPCDGIITCRVGPPSRSGPHQWGSYAPTCGLAAKTVTREPEQGRSRYFITEPGMGYRFHVPDA